MNLAKTAYQGITRTFEHYKGKIQRVNQIRRERDQAMQAQLDADMHPKERDPHYLAEKPKSYPAPSVMGVGRRIVK